jgi:hypothetical protein
MPDIYPIAGILPKTVADLAAFEVWIRCRNCGRIVRLDPARIQVHRHTASPAFLAKFRCKANAGADPRAAVPMPMQSRSATSHQLPLASLNRPARSGLWIDPATGASTPMILSTNSPSPNRGALNRLLWAAGRAQEPAQGTVSRRPLWDSLVSARRLCHAGKSALPHPDEHSAARSAEAAQVQGLQAQIPPHRGLGAATVKTALEPQSAAREPIMVIAPRGQAVPTKKTSDPFIEHLWEDLVQAKLPPGGHEESWGDTPTRIRNRFTASVRKAMQSGAAFQASVVPVYATRPFANDSEPKAGLKTKKKPAKKRSA